MLGLCWHSFFAGYASKGSTILQFEIQDVICRMFWLRTMFIFAFHGTNLTIKLPGAIVVALRPTNSTGTYTYLLHFTLSYTIMKILK